MILTTHGTLTQNSNDSELTGTPEKQLHLMLSQLGSELAMIHTATGEIMAFYWSLAEQYHVSGDRLLGQSLSEEFSPVDEGAYRQRISQVLEQLTPAKFDEVFRSGEQYLQFELMVSPIIPPQGNANRVLVLGKLLSSPQTSPVLNPQTQLISYLRSDSSERYQRLLTQIAWNIRRTLDLDTIWQQTVKGLGKALEADWCVIYSPFSSEASQQLQNANQITVNISADTQFQGVAEYKTPSIASRLGVSFQGTDSPYYQQALQTLAPLAWEEPATETTHKQAVLAVATYYQNHPNSLLVVAQEAKADGTLHQWTSEEVDLVRELAEQVGVAIAHATLFAESQALAKKVQQANVDLLEKHYELEEARKQAEEASRLKSEFLANTSHELRTPLNGMIGFLKLVMDGMADDPEEQATFLEEAYRSSVHLLDLINDVLDIAKIEAGKMQLDLSPVKLDELLTALGNFSKPLANQKHLDFKIQKLETLDEIILYGNYQRILQVLLNLVGNAIKFTREGGITISYEITRKPVVIQNQECPGFVKVRVADTGIGVSLEKQDKLFQKFSQIDGARTREFGGTGLGLAISHKLVEAMGGEVNFFSMGEGLGSTVTFTIPLFQMPVVSSTINTSEAGSRGF